MFRLRSFITVMLLVSVFLISASPAGAYAYEIPDYDFMGPVFGLGVAPDGSLLVPDAGAGVVVFRKGAAGTPVALPGVGDVDSVGQERMFAITGGGDSPTSAMLFTIFKGEVVPVADLGLFEETYNPDGTDINPNPFDVEALNAEQALVADAGANALLLADIYGGISVVAIFPEELVSTANAKALVGCDTQPIPDLAFVCGLPEMIPAQPVSTSVAVGPDGAYYVGELKGIPAPLGESRVWRIEPGAENAVCGVDPECSVVLDGFTSIVDLFFSPSGTLYVTEYDEASWLGMELGQGVGGTVNACAFGGWTCEVVASGLPLPIATVEGKHGVVYTVINNLFPDQVEVVALP